MLLRTYAPSVHTLFESPSPSKTLLRLTAPPKLLLSRTQHLHAVVQVQDDFKLPPPLADFKSALPPMPLPIPPKLPRRRTLKSEPIPLDDGFKLTPSLGFLS